MSTSNSAPKKCMLAFGQASAMVACSRVFRLKPSVALPLSVLKISRFNRLGNSGTICTGLHDIKSPKYIQRRWVMSRQISRSGDSFFMPEPLVDGAQQSGKGTGSAGRQRGYGQVAAYDLAGQRH